MKIKQIICDSGREDAAIIFDNGNKITYKHERDCCEYNYMDLESLSNDVYINEDFDPELIFKPIEDLGFSFGNPGKMIFIPCYSEQNGYYTDLITICYNGTPVINVNCREVIE